MLADSSSQRLLAPSCHKRIAAASAASERPIHTGISVALPATGSDVNFLSAAAGCMASHFSGTALSVKRRIRGVAARLTHDASDATVALGHFFPCRDAEDQSLRAFRRWRDRKSCSAKRSGRQSCARYSARVQSVQLGHHSFQMEPLQPCPQAERPLYPLLPQSHAAGRCGGCDSSGNLLQHFHQSFTRVRFTHGRLRAGDAQHFGECQPIASCRAGAELMVGPGHRGRRALAEINITPLVDVVLVLLIIFMLTAPILQSGIEVEVPKTRTVKEITEERLVISIDKAQRVYLGNDAINIHVLPQTLRAKIRDPQSQPIYLRADAGVPFGVFATVMDSVKQAGITNVSIVTQPLEEHAQR